MTFSPNHWCNEITIEHYIQSFISLFVQDTRKRLKLDAAHRPFCILSNFKAQHTDRVLQLLEDNSIDTVYQQTVQENS